MEVTRESKIGTAEVECPFTSNYSGISINACLDWNEYYYELWFEMGDSREDYEEYGTEDIWDEEDKDFEDMGVVMCRTLEEVNDVISKVTDDYCGFVDDDDYGIRAFY